MVHAESSTADKKTKQSNRIWYERIPIVSLTQMRLVRLIRNDSFHYRGGAIIHAIGRGLLPC
jgi:hypothetical protein